MAYRSQLTSEVLNRLTTLRAVCIDALTRLGQEEVRQLWESLIEPAMSWPRKTLSETQRIGDSRYFRRPGLTAQFPGSPSGRCRHHAR